mmetsp:Transcript_12949/g.29335  ORF Transcript_12949/g.29335 Transcript_12949/m.29335 type:complete len:149 (+) Transcript_12949:400-846(+)
MRRSHFQGGGKLLSRLPPRLGGRALVVPVGVGKLRLTGGKGVLRKQRHVQEVEVLVPRKRRMTAMRVIPIMAMTTLSQERIRLKDEGEESELEEMTENLLEKPMIVSDTEIVVKEIETGKSEKEVMSETETEVERETWIATGVVMTGT